MEASSQTLDCQTHGDRPATTRSTWHRRVCGRKQRGATAHLMGQSMRKAGSQPVPTGNHSKWLRTRHSKLEGEPWTQQWQGTRPLHAEARELAQSRPHSPDQTVSLQNGPVLKRAGGDQTTDRTRETEVKDSECPEASKGRKQMQELGKHTADICTRLKNRERGAVRLEKYYCQ